MTDFLIKHFISDSENTDDPVVREQYGVLGGVLGVICNSILFIIKIIVGVAIGSIAVISDAFNNLSDLGSSLVSIIGARMGGKRADKEHPYGHGRAEYISALIISFLIIFFGFELFKSSAKKIFSPSDINLTAVSVGVLIISIPVKLWMWHYNRILAKRISSEILYAASKDSISDVIASAAVILSAVAAHFVNFPIDGTVGVCVSVLVIWTGVGIARDTINRLLGVAPTPELTEKIENILLERKDILGMHDLMIHDYGPERKIASVHAEVPDNISICDIHRIIDSAEHEIRDKTGVDIVIHMDPVACPIPPTDKSDKSDENRADIDKNVTF